MIGAPLGQAEAERLFADSEGNPLFLVEAVQAGTEGAISASPRSGGAVGRVQAVIAARLTRLSSAASELAGIAATIGREFSARVLADASDLEDQAFVGGLDELWRRGIVRAYQLETYDFSHGRIREAAYQTLGPAQRGVTTCASRARSSARMQATWTPRAACSPPSTRPPARTRGRAVVGASGGRRAATARPCGRRASARARPRVVAELPPSGSVTAASWRCSPRCPPRWLPWTAIVGAPHRRPRARAGAGRTARGRARGAAGALTRPCGFDAG